MTQALELDSEVLSSTRPTYHGLNRPEAVHDPVNHPEHYTWMPNGIEVIDVTELFNFNLGAALGYIMRSGRKVPAGKSPGEAAIEDLKKARRHLDREIARMERGLRP